MYMGVDEYEDVCANVSQAGIGQWQTSHWRFAGCLTLLVAGRPSWHSQRLGGEVSGACSEVNHVLAGRRGPSQGQEYAQR